MKKSEKKLCESCKKGSLEEVKRLLKKKLFGGSPNININESGIGNTPLINAAANGHETILKYLLDKGANIDGLNRNSETALIHALKNNQPEIARLLILEKADVLIKDTKDRSTLHLACQIGCADIVEILVKKGVDINQKDINGNTALDFALINRFNDIEKFLISSGAKQNSYKTVSLDNKLICDICGFETTLQNSYLLSTKDVASSMNYWEQQLSRFAPIVRQMNNEQEKINILHNEIKRITDDDSSWLVCEACSNKFNFDKEKARERALNPDALVNDKKCNYEETVKFITPLIEKICAVESSSFLTEKETKKYWQCLNCGGVFFKKDREMNEFFLKTGSVMGGITCGSCHTRYNLEDIYKGKYDMYADDEIIDEMFANPSEVNSDNNTKTYFFRGQIIKGPASK
jgi:transcription elongation factor Elf1